MWSQYSQKDKTPGWDKYSLLKSYWSGFEKYKQSEEATKMTQENKMNVKKKVLHHTTGSRGYARKEESWQEQEQKAIQLGAAPVIANWTKRSKRFVLGHGAVLTAEGRMEFKTDKVKEVVEMIEKAHAESKQGTFVPSRDMNELNYVLQSKEHPGRTRGYGNRPWKHPLKSTADSYRKRENMMSYSKTRYTKRCRTFCRLKGRRCKGIYKNRCRHNYNNYWPVLWLKGYVIVLMDRVKPGHRRSKLEYPGENGE
jgi:hypothetical protein